MNYRHDFHAGNFADVFKHVVLTRILLYLARKPAPFRVVDTHAGSGSYDLASEAAERTAEWRDGIGRLDAAAMEPEARALIEPYLALARARDRRYPGSPAIALALTRPFDRLLFCETEPAALARLRACMGKDRRAKAMALDGYVGLNAFVPPVERRGLVLVDPPFEAADEFDRLASAIPAALAKWRDGVFAVWMPLKDRRGPDRLVAALKGAGAGEVLRLELAVDRPAVEGPLVATAMVVVNPPYVLAEEMACLLPALARQLAPHGRGASRVARA